MLISCARWQVTGRAGGQAGTSSWAGSLRDRRQLLLCPACHPPCAAGRQGMAVGTQCPWAAACPSLSAHGQESGAGRKESKFGGRRLVIPGSSAETPLLGEAGGVPLGKGRTGSRVQLPQPVRGTHATEGCLPAPGSLWVQSWHPRQPVFCVCPASVLPRQAGAGIAG